MRIVIFLIILTRIIPFHTRGQEEFIPPPTRVITRVPFHMLTGGIVIVKARLDNFPDSLNFVLDTGSGGISLDSTTAADLGVKTQLSDRTVRGIAGIRQVHFAYDHSLHLPGLTVDSLDFHINNYEVLTSAYGERIDGIIGYSFLSRYIIFLNYDSSHFRVQTKGTIRYPRGGFMYKPLLVNIPVVNLELKDERELQSRFYFDTGAGMCLLLSNEFVQDSAFIKQPRRVRKRQWFNSQAEGLGGKTAMKFGVIRQLKLGPYRFRNVPTFIFDDTYNVTSYPYLGGLIGNDILRRFNTYLNYEKREIYMIPNTHFKDQFDYSYTGLGMYIVDGNITILDIMKDSPAEEAGFQEGDIVLSINNNFSKHIQTYKNMLQKPGEKVKILVLREDGPVILTLKVKSVF